MKIHSYVTPKARPGSSRLDRAGLYAVDYISEGEIVAVWGGKIYTADECDSLSSVNADFVTHTVSVFWNIYLGSSQPEIRDDSELINHSCTPNLAVKGQIIVVATRHIFPGEELTFDYDTTEAWAEPFQCACGSRECRGIIQGAMAQPRHFLDDRHDQLSWYLSQCQTNEVWPDRGGVLGIARRPQP